jgi:repressor LexA
MTEQEYGKIIAKNLKRLAYEHNKTQTDIANDLGISKTTLSSWMSGYRTPKMSNIDRLSKYFHITRQELTEPHGIVPVEQMSAFERNIILAYRNASTDRKEAVLLLLGMKE